MKLSVLDKIDSSIEILNGNAYEMDFVSISNTDDPQENSIVFLKNKKYLNLLGLRSSHAEFKSCLILVEKNYWDGLSVEVKQNLESKFGFLGTIQRVDHAMCLLSKPFYDHKFSHLNYQVDGRQFDTCEIHPDVEISQNVFIGEGVKIGKGTKILPGCNILPNVEIGENCILYPNITCYPYTTIKNNVRIHAGTVLGTDGFGYNFFDGKHQKVWHFSGVIIHNDVEIGCNSMIDAGAFTPTEIGFGSKIDNDVQISHNVKVREHVIICGKTGLAGSVEAKNYSAFGAGAGVAPAAIIEEGVQIAARAVVSENAVIPKGSVFAGHPARPLRD